MKDNTQKWNEMKWSSRIEQAQHNNNKYWIRNTARRAMAEKNLLCKYRICFCCFWWAAFALPMCLRFKHFPVENSNRISGIFGEIKIVESLGEGIWIYVNACYSRILHACSSGTKFGWKHVSMEIPFFGNMEGKPPQALKWDSNMGERERDSCDFMLWNVDGNLNCDREDGRFMVHHHRSMTRG